MKKLFTFAAALLIGISSFAQTCHEDTWIDIDDCIYLNNAVKIKAFNQYGFGFSQIQSGVDNIDFNMGRCFSFYMDMLSFNTNITRNGHLRFHSALRWTFDNYVTKDNLVFESEMVPGTLNAYVSATKLDKSKMRADYLGVPVGFVYRNNGFKIYANAIGEIRTGSITKVKFADGEKEKDRLEGLEDLRASVECGVGYKNIGLFYKCSLTPTFRKTTFPTSDEKIMTVGVVIGI